LRFSLAFFGKPLGKSILQDARQTQPRRKRKDLRHERSHATRAGQIALAKERFKTGLRVSCIAGDYTEARFDEPFDIVLSALSIHHLNAAAKSGLYRRIFDWLSSGGELLNADQIVSAHPELQGRFETLWTERCIENGFTPAEIERMKRSMLLDDPSPAEEQLAWLRAAGFAIADCVYKYLNFAVLYARK
jgi:tRNA (cmo5U34)-methyltransferase